MVSIADYLASEEGSDVKHEFLGGVVHAMAGATNRHNTIAVNTLISLGTQLAGKSCETFNSDTKVRLRFPDHTRFYYPDAMVVCESNAGDSHFQDSPVVIVEVLSESTARYDRFEKRDAYFTLPSLKVLILVEQNLPSVAVHRRGADGEFALEEYDGMEAMVALPEIECELPLNSVYQRVTFPVP